LHRKSTVDGKKTEGGDSIVHVPPTAAELAALKVKDSGTTTPTSQEEDLERVLNSLNMAVSKKTAFSFSDETRLLLKQFTQILKDIQSGAPHAYTDLTTFLNSSSGHLSSLFDSAPSFLKSLISTIPFPLARKLDKKSPKDVSVDFLKDLAKPGVITGLLRNILSVLRTRFPAFVGSNALLSLGLFVLLIGVWYCYKRGKEERLKEEEEEEEAAETSHAPSVGGKEEEDEVLVEGTHAQDNTDHGLGTHISPHTGSQSQSSPGLQETSVFRDATLNLVPVVAAGDGEDTDTPLQIESDVVPSHGPSEKKIKRGWLR